MKVSSILGISILFSQSTNAVLSGRGQAGKNFQYDYCSTGHSLQVYEDTANHFVEVFGGYKVPIDQYTCPFHPNNLAYLRDSKQLQSWRNAKVGATGKITCPICDKAFKSQDFFDLHLKSHHSSPAMQHYNYYLGQENRISGATRDGISHQGRQFCLADYCDIVPCKFNSHAGHPTAKVKKTMEQIQ